MARFFRNTDSDYLQIGSADISAPPFAMCCWFTTNNLTRTDTILHIGDLSDDEWYYLAILGVSLGDPLAAGTKGIGGSSHADSTVAVTADVWHHGCAIFAAVNDRRVLLDNAGKGTGASSHTPTAGNIDNTTIGAFAFNNAYFNFHSGAIAEMAVYDLSLLPGATNALKADWFEAHVLPGLAAKFSPLFYPLGLIRYRPFGGLLDASDGDHDLIGAHNMTAFNTPTTADHLPIIYPISPIAVPWLIAVGNPWYAYAQQ